MGHAGRTRAHERFGIDAMLDRMQAVFEAAVAREAATARLPSERRLHVAFPYNEILPKRSAHDVYVFTTAVAMAEAGAQSSLIAGRGGPDEAALHAHYHTTTPATFNAVFLPIVRQNRGLPVTLNGVFYRAAGRWVASCGADWLVTSVLKQALFHARHRLPRVRHAHEVHELAWYPGRDARAPTIAPRLARERELLAAVDLVVVTTQALEAVLRAPPYGIATPILVLPLAAPRAPELPPLQPSAHGTLRLGYVGQLYREQGVELLLDALASQSDWTLDVVGGRAEEVAALRARAESLGIDKRVIWHGFVPPKDIASRVANVDVFVAPFLAEGRMPYVAHTKLAEYRAWRRPVVAPDLPVVHEHFGHGGLAVFAAGNAASLGDAIKELSHRERLARLAAESAAAPAEPDAVERAGAYLRALGGRPQ
jgi:glycosyltransferase involved in cell wall biosynthesis